MARSVTIQYIDDCPNVPIVRSRLHEAAHAAGADISLVEEKVETIADAEQLGFTGSPTVLVDGVDPFARPGTSPAVACRVYATPSGLSGAPTVDQLVDVLRN
ncbi:alkylmercury lyase [Knoellia sinensis KCTC 19936]|uniref:Alkylmercury lyase n=1 Tax=Knoellia sinensis KCTC 19936 TaxID=1385520 RepID=A0A0A0J7W4_9MICO|nr:hypothetical protein [Knoellia sinensis]KGN32132.1 alkylmercury lyase [Knoellia sinensis KCTC 19936]